MIAMIRDFNGWCKLRSRLCIMQCTQLDGMQVTRKKWV